MKKQQGFGAVYLLLALIIIGAIGGIGYYVYNAQKNSNTALDNATKSQSEPQKSEAKQVVPEGFVEYQSKELGIKFVYPKEWGAVTTKKMDAEKGESQVLQFSKNVFGEGSILNIALETSDFQSSYPREGFNAGFTNYETHKKDIESQDNQRKTGSINYDTTILSSADNSLIYGGYDCLSGGDYVAGMTKLTGTKFAGLEVGLFKSFATDSSGYCGDGTTQKRVSDTADKSFVKQLETILKSVKTL